MIVCHCQNISDRDIHAAINWMRAAQSETLITPGKVHRALGKVAEQEARALYKEAREHCHDIGDHISKQLF